MASPVLTVPTAPSVFDLDPRSPNSWTARSFTTLLPSDSPSQALFPKHSQASLLLAARTDNAHTVRPPQIPPLAIQHTRQHSFVKRNLHFILSAALLHISIVVLTTLLVLIITAATSNPPKRINPSYYLGIILSVAASVASVILIYIKYIERQGPSLNEDPGSPTSPTHNDNNIELGHLPAPVTTFRGAISNSEEQEHRFRDPRRSIVVSRIPLTTASARIAGSNNGPRALEDVNLAPEPTMHTQYDRQRDSTSTAAALQRFLENELQRQEKVRRRISTWLRGVPPPAPPPIQSSAPTYPPPPITSLPPRPPKHKARDPIRLAELDKEIEAYLGFPAPTLFVAEARKEIDGETETVDEDDDEEEIDYGNLPPAIPRDGARSRRPMLSDPITVLHVGPMRESPRQKGAPLVKEVEGSGGSGCGGSGAAAAAPSAAAAATVSTATAPTPSLPPPRLSSRANTKVGVQGSLRGGSEERDSLAEKWLKKMIRGVDVERWVGPAVAVAVAVDGKGKCKSKRGKGWRWRFWS
ncbi:MAG: hypothetical protein L6R38_004791 [Xanthoria sp. 2 TBL-2021]|nr:MAG: hypothetical protein L6R38_004791 [Xanthoria sp. 2 TBL-2021]